MVLASDFLPQFAELDKPVQRAVLAALRKFPEHTHAGLHLEKLAGAKDRNIRTIRITDFYRGIVLAPHNGDSYILVAVLPHDEANRYATSKVFTVNHALGVLEVRDQCALDQFEPALRAAAGSGAPPLFARVKDGELIRLGIDAKILPIVRLLTAEEHLEAMERSFPRPQYDALVGLAAGLPADAVWQELCERLLADPPPDLVDTNDLTAAAERTPDRYAVVSGPEELASILAHPFAAWRTFLHPRQEAIAYRPSYNGPVLVSGGAGTGKTVTAVHRAAFLARQLAGRLPDGTGADILLTTFTNNLATALADQLALLLDGADLRARVDVMTVNKLGYQVVSQAGGRQPQIIGQNALEALWKAAARHIDNAFSASFLQREWEQVILAQDLPDRDSYLASSRSGRGRAISSAQRERAWAGISHVLGALRAAGQRTHIQVMADAARILAEQERPRYRHVLVDEGQDLHPAQWRLLRQAVARGPDALFIVNDPHQRIYENRVSLARVGIEVRGRGRRLTLSYRTTQEILNWSVRVLDRSSATGLDDEPDTLAGYRSQIHGRRPLVRAFLNWDAELAGLITQVRDWLAAGVEPPAIGVAARTSYRAKEIRTALDRAGIATAATHRAETVRVSTMHGMKGLEFRCVAVVGVEEGTVPAPAAVTAYEDDPAANLQDTQRERCVLFVACTRARDALYVSHTKHPSQFLPG